MPIPCKSLVLTRNVKRRVREGDPLQVASIGSSFIFMEAIIKDKKRLS